MIEDTVSTMPAPANAAAGAAAGQPPMIQVRALRHAYGPRVALKDVSLEVGRGEIFGLLGPNGGGKTTLFRILATLLRPTAGEAVLGGCNVVHQPDAVRRRLGVVFQSPSLDEHLTVRENLEYQGRMYGLHGRALRDRVDELLVLFTIADRKRDPAGTLSGGLRRRVEVAKGVLHRPAVLLLDEPSTGLDPGARRDLWHLLEALRRENGVTVLLTTHFMDEADRCDRVVILHQGNVVAQGRPDDLKGEIGGDVVSVATRDPERLRTMIAERFGPGPTVINGTVRMERPSGHTFLPQLIEAFPGEIDAITVGKPTLEDVFFARTGHRFWEDAA